MDLRTYYQRIREADESLNGEHIVMVSLPTPEGGKAGVKTEAPRVIAAKMIAEQRARVATADEAREFHEANRAAKEDFEENERLRRLQVVVVAQDSKKQKERG